jgi:hypothetical protein
MMIFPPNRYKEPLKNHDMQHEINVLLCILEQLNKFSYRKEIADISSVINKILARKQVDLGTLRTQLIKIYKNESIQQQYYNKQFYDALFVFLLLLAKYNPPASYRNDEGELECPIGYTVIDPNDRLLVINGVHFDRQSLESWIKDKDIVTNPSTQLPFSQRELSYLNARIKNLTPEIPILEHATQEPQPIPLSFKQKAKNFLKKCGNYLTSNVRSLFFQLIFVIFGAMFGMLLLAMLISFGVIVPLSLGVLGYALFGAAVLGGVFGGSLFAILKKHCGQFCFGIAPIPVPAEPPLLLKENEKRPMIELEQGQFLLYVIQNQGRFPQQALESKMMPSLDSTQQIHHSIELDVSKVTTPNNLTQPLLTMNDTGTLLTHLPHYKPTQMSFPSPIKTFGDKLRRE